MTAFDKAYEEVKTLAEKFQNNLAFFTRPDYQEAEARMHFINPFFEALGWDVTSKDHPNPYEQEVKVEKTQKQQQSKAQKRADYAFFMAPNFKDVKFFVEAKKPSVELKHPDNYFQTIRYGWNANTPIAVLTDFEQFHIIDCRYKPDIRYVFNGQHKEFRFTDYSDKEKFAEIYWLFSREAVLNNSLQKFADSLPKPKGKDIQKTLFKGGYQAIDDSFLEYIDNIREELAKAFKKNDESLGSEALTEAVTRTIDRLVFIRFLEDKLIEPNNHVSEWRSWNNFIADCRKLDAKYNGVVFKEHSLLDKKGFVGAEEKMFLDICSDISNLNSPYDFNYIPIHILGSIYERFLGKVVIATEHRARIEEKPEVRKAGGVYYTPKYIVDYIVKNTVWKCINDKTPKQIAELRFADIACGSGSFLIGVYDYLLDYHKKYYQKKFSDRTEPLDARNEDFGNVEYKDKKWLLTLKQKQDILLNNIYGVDIDRQAVEVTQLSLFLKMLEEETTSSIQVKLFSKVLPDLSKNIVCGNSLIGTDIRDSQLSFAKGESIDLSISLQEEMKLNPMDFENAFPSIKRSGGFDAIVGNPPYVNLSALPERERRYYQAKYEVCRNKSDLYSFFIERATKILKKDIGRLGYIVPHTWLATDSFQLLRKLLFRSDRIEQLVEMGFKVFKDAIVSTVILICSSKNKKIVVYDKTFRKKFEIDSKKCKDDGFMIDLEWDAEKEKIYSRLNNNTSHLNEVIEFSRGIKTSDDGRFITTANKGQSHKKIYRGKNIKAYQLNWAGEYVWYRPDLMKEKVGSLSHSKEFFEVPEKLITQRVNSSRQLLVAYDNEQQYFLDTTNVSRYSSWDKKHSLKYICALLNSKLINYWYCNKYKMPTIGGYELHSIPFRKINFKNKEEKALHDQLVTLVTQMLETKKQLQNTKTEGDKTFLENKCSSLDRQIDNLVYQLYGLSEEEIKIVEDS